MLAVDAVGAQGLVLWRKRTGVRENKGRWGQQAVELEEAITGLLLYLRRWVHLREQATKYWWRRDLGCRRLRYCRSRYAVMCGCSKVELLFVRAGFWYLDGQYYISAEGQYELRRLRVWLELRRHP